jgi:hypothetical protein
MQRSYKLRHLGKIDGSPSASMRWSVLVEAEERRCGDMAGTASVRCGGSGLARSFDGFMFAGAVQGLRTQRRVQQRPILAQRGRSRSAEQGRVL